MTDSTMDNDAKAKKLAREGKNITQISEELGISWGEAAGYLPASSWRGAKVRITIRLEKLATETDPAKRKKMAEEADLYVDFLL